MPTAQARAAAILAEFCQAQAELVGKAPVILTDGKAGTVDHVWFDELHGLRISIRGHDGRWPVSTIKLAQTDFNTSRELVRSASLAASDPLATFFRGAGGRECSKNASSSPLQLETRELR